MQREHWKSRSGFILATAGSAVGLGNIWRFPTAVGLNGGGAFVLVYLIIIILIGVPVMICELSIGRKGQKDIVGSYTSIKKSPLWYGVGFLGIIAGFVMLSFYSVIAGWSFSYIFKFFGGTFLEAFSLKEVEMVYNDLVQNPIQPIIWQFIFLSFSALIVVKGIGKGIEKYSKLLMPILFVLLVLLAIRSVTLEGAMEGIIWFLRPDFTSINLRIVLGALGQVFFSLSLGMGAILTYGSYMNKKSSIPSNAVLISLADLSISFVSGLIIIPAVFAFNLEPTAGPSLIFMTLPAVFGAIPFGSFFGGLFFILLTIAAITSSISILEVVVAYFIDELKWNRKKSTIATSAAIFIVGIPIALSQGVLSNLTLWGMDLLELADNLTARVLLPISGLMSVIFVGWVWGEKNALEHIRLHDVKFRAGKTWSTMVKYVMPIILVYILISGFF